MDSRTCPKFSRVFGPLLRGRKVRQEEEKVFPYAFLLFLCHTHANVKEKSKERGLQKKPMGFWLLKNNFVQQILHIRTASGLRAPTHNPRAHSHLDLEAEFTVSKVLHGNNMICQKERRLFRIRENTSPQKHPTHPPKKVRNAISI